MLLLFSYTLSFQPLLILFVLTLRIGTLLFAFVPLLLHLCILFVLALRVNTLLFAFFALCLLHLFFILFALALGIVCTRKPKAAGNSAVSNYPGPLALTSRRLSG